MFDVDSSLLDLVNNLFIFLNIFFITILNLELNISIILHLFFQSVLATRREIQYMKLQQHSTFQARELGDFVPIKNDGGSRMMRDDDADDDDDDEADEGRIQVRGLELPSDRPER